MTELNSFSATAFHAVLGKALEIQFTQYLELWKDVQEFGFKSQIDGESDSWQNYFRRFGFTVDSSRIIITLLSCSYLEGMINFYIESKTDAEQFIIFDRRPLLEKWVTIPRLFIPQYTLPKNEQLYNDLFLLIKERNAIAHPKPIFDINGKRVHKGDEHKPPINGHEFTLRNASLPSKLIENLWRYDQSDVVRLIKFVSEVDIK